MSCNNTSKRCLKRFGARPTFPTFLKPRNLKMDSRKPTPRTNIDGAHQQGVYVSAGARLSASFSQYKNVHLLFTIACLLIAFDWIPAKSALGGLKYRLIESATYVRFLPSGIQVLTLAMVTTVIWAIYLHGSHHLRFAYNCFIKPFIQTKVDGVGSEDHQKRLEQFYDGQADVYDITRKSLLRGRNNMLKLCAAQLRQVYPCQMPMFQGDRFGFNSISPPSSPLYLSMIGKQFAWIDVGGGTGENIERMNQYFPISNFEHVYMVDITPSLCEIARKRFEKLGWSNVKVLCMDASKFEIPMEDGDDLDIALITMSYSLTMVENYYPIIDHLQKLLAPTGIFGVADFYCPSKRSADSTRQISWLMRWFWAIWFDLDNVYLSPGRREYLEYKFKTVKQISTLNTFIRPFIKIPYYVWIGAQKCMKGFNSSPAKCY